MPVFAIPDYVSGKIIQRGKQNENKIRIEKENLEKQLREIHTLERALA
jgi:hypothetical protein